MARLFVPPDRLGDERVRLEGEQHRYLARVLRLHGGDAVTVFDGAGNEIDASIESISAGTTVLLLGQRRAGVVPLGRPVLLLQAVPKSDRMDLLVQKTTELGVARICPVVTERTVVQADRGNAGRGDNRLRRWRLIAQEAARQCGRADLPIIDEPRSLGEALALTPAGCVRFFAWEQASSDQRTLPLRRALSGDEPAVALLVGPEGGFTEAEAQAARDAGFTAVGLGRRILRCETAGIVAVALAQAALGALD
jgi:16S rRNA (uracil1498-N3)-methyltransferase